MDTSISVFNLFFFSASYNIIMYNLILISNRKQIIDRYTFLSLSCKNIDNIDTNDIFFNAMLSMSP